jgi:RNA polymerase-binding transcription factor
MDPADLRRFHRLLLKKQRELSSAPGEVRSRLPATGGLKGDLIDQANADEEAELQIHLHQTEGRLARAIEEALVRIKKRTYGVCEACGHPISGVRLNAVPWARHCRECKERERSAA